MKQICICEFVVQNTFVGQPWKVTEFTKMGFPTEKVGIGRNTPWKYMQIKTGVFMYEANIS